MYSGPLVFTRAKSNLKSRRLYSHPVDKSTGVVCDQSILLTIPKSAGDYPDKLCRVKYYDAETDKNLVFLPSHPDDKSKLLQRCRAADRTRSLNAV
jgi:hypothetical protein